MAADRIVAKKYGDVVLVLAAAAAWPAIRGIDHRFISFSDGVYTYVGSAVAAHGLHELYRSIVLSQPPGAVLVVATLWRLSPHIETIRFALAVLSGLTALLTYALARINGLPGRLAVLAGFIALTAPIHAELSGVDGEAVLAPLALGLAISLSSRRWTLSGVLVGAGAFFKLTWAPFVIVAVLISARSERSATTIGQTVLAALTTATGLWSAAVVGFGWSPHDLLVEMVVGQSRSGLQVGLFGALLAITLLLWWPLLLLSIPGRRTLNEPTVLLLSASLISGVFMLKQGTFFNVVDPAEPFLAIAAVNGAVELWRRWTRRTLILLAACVLALALHIASVVNRQTAEALPFPIGAAFINTDNQEVVDRAAAAIDRHSRPGEAILVNPLLALTARRHEIDDQADWFILHALGRNCGPKTRHSLCGVWGRLKAAAKGGSAAVVSVDANVVSFDRTFATDTGVTVMERVFRAHHPPLDTKIYARRRQQPTKPR
jgi:hypothetical protein